MYEIIPAKKKVKVKNHDYMFKDFASFYELADLITVPLVGRYSIGIKTDVMKDVVDFVSKEQNYASLMISIYVPEAIVDYMTLRNTNMNVIGTFSDFDKFKEMAQEKEVLFDKEMLGVLYSSIEHDIDSMEEALSLLVEEYGKQVVINEKMLSELFVLNKTVYPRTVLLSYLRMDRWRRSKLDRCLKDIGNDAVLGAMVKNVKAFMDAKVKFYKSGSATELVKSINTVNLQIMYRILVLERKGLNDVELLMDFYERGLSQNDFIYGEED